MGFEIAFVVAQERDLNLVCERGWNQNAFSPKDACWQRKTTAALTPQRAIKCSISMKNFNNALSEVKEKIRNVVCVGKLISE